MTGKARHHPIRRRPPSDYSACANSTLSVPLLLEALGREWRIDTFGLAVFSACAFSLMNCTTRIPCLDGLRGLAALAVMLFHFNIFFLPQARLTEIAPFVSRGYLAVDLFFLLSGFVMAHVYGRLLGSNWRAHWRHFAVSRFARLYPLFAITTMVIVSLVTLYHAPTKEVSFSGRSLALQPIMLQQWSSGLSWNYPSWSI